LEVQGSFVLTYMVGIIPPNLRSQETDKGVPHARARRRRPGRARAGRGEEWRGMARRGWPARERASGRAWCGCVNF
jgi:hypothetical protein